MQNDSKSPMSEGEHALRYSEELLRSLRYSDGSSIVSQPTSTSSSASSSRKSSTQSSPESSKILSLQQQYRLAFFTWWEGLGVEKQLARLGLSPDEIEQLNKFLLAWNPLKEEGKEKYGFKLRRTIVKSKSPDEKNNGGLKFSSARGKIKIADEEYDLPCSLLHIDGTDFLMGRKLGKGHSATVKEVFPVQLAESGNGLIIGAPRAVRIESGKTPDARQQIENVKKYTTKVYGYASSIKKAPTGKKVYLIIPEIPGNSYRRLILAEDRIRFDAKQLYQLGLAAVVAMNFLHDLRIVHGDFTFNNLNFSKIYKSVYAVFPYDFGFSLDADTSSQRHEACGTHAYMAPEIFEKEYLTIKTDVWSLGIVLLRLLCERDEPFVEFRSNQKEFQKLKWHEYAPDELASFVPVPDVNCLNFHGPQEIQKQVKSLLAGFFQPEEKRDIDFGKVISSFENIIDKIPSRIEVEVVVDDVEKNLTPFLYQGVIITTWPQAFRHVYGATYENQLSYWQYLGLVPRENQKKWIYYLTGAFFVVFCNSILKAIETFFCFYYMSPSSAKTPHWKVISGLFGLLYYVIKPISSPLASLNGVKKQELCKGFYDSYTGFYYVIIVLYSFLVNIGAFFLFAHGITELSVAIIGNENSKALGRAFFSTYVESYPDETQAGAILLIVAMIAILDFVNAKLMHPDARLCGKPLWKQPLDGGENFKTQRRRLLSDPNASRVGMTLFPDRGMPRSVSYSTSSDTWSASPTPPLLTRSLSSAKSSVSSQVFFDDKPFKGLQASFNS